MDLFDEPQVPTSSFTFASPLPPPGPHIGSLLNRLTRAEHDGQGLCASRIAGLLAYHWMRYGRYRAALHWAEWSLQLHPSGPAAPSGFHGLNWRAWFMLKLLLGQGDADIPREGWLFQTLEVQRRIYQGRFGEALKLAHDLWHAATRRESLADLLNPYVRLLLAAGATKEALEAAEKGLYLSEGLPPQHKAQSWLAYGIALSPGDPARGSRFLEAAHDQLAVPWRVQAALYLAHLGQAEHARSLRQAADPYLREMAPQGLAFLLYPLKPKAEMQEVEGLELNFLGSSEARFKDQRLELRPRFAEFLAVLAAHPKGLSAEQLALAVYGEHHDSACCKTELSRLKRSVPLESRPYRLGVPVRADFLELPALVKEGRLGQAIELYQGPLLPKSEAPEVRMLGENIEETLRGSVIESGNPELLWKLSSRIHDDLELWETLEARLSQGDPRRGLARAQVNSLRRSWGV